MKKVIILSLPEKRKDNAQVGRSGRPDHQGVTQEKPLAEKKNTRSK